MESPVVLDKPPEYHGKRDERGFPFDEEESGAWSSLAARHPGIAARLRQRPATWARKRRPSSQDATEDFGDSFGGFDRFPFDDIPPEFRDSFPSHWGRRFEEPQPSAHAQQPAQQPAPQSPQPQQATTATQTDVGPADPHTPLPQYGLRNTVDLGQKSAADPSVDADERGPRSMSAPPEARPAPAMSSPREHPEPQPHGTVRHIPIFVEGRDEPVINKSVDHGAQFGETKPPPPPPPHVDRDQYFADDGPAFHHPPNFSRAFGTPFNKGFRQGPQPFTQQKAYPQSAFARGASPQRSQSPKQPHPEEFMKTHHEPRAQPAHHPQQQQHQQQQHQQQQHQQQQAPPQPQQQQQQPHAPSPPPKPASNDPITVILGIQTDVLNLMSEVENFTGTKKDKKYIYLDEMLTRNLIKLDNIETDGKENIRLARKEAIKCIQKCIAVLEAKAESNSGAAAAAAPAQDVNMQPEAAGDTTTNGEVDMKEDNTKEEPKAETQPTDQPKEVQEQNEQKPEEPEKVEAKSEEAKEAQQPPDTRPEETRAVLVEKPQQETDKTTTPKKKVVKKRDKSKDTPKDSNKEGDSKLESMQVDDKGDQDSNKMEVDGASASQ